MKHNLNQSQMMVQKQTQTIDSKKKIDKKKCDKINNN